MRHRLVPVAALLLLAGCVAGQVPPPPVSGAVGDVDIRVGAGMWRGWPPNLSRWATPIHVTLDNRGGTPVRVSHDDFALVASGVRLPAVLPYEVRGVVHRPPPPSMPSAGFSLDAINPTVTQDWALRAPPVPAEADAAYVGEQFTLPSQDVLNWALPEGIVQPGGVARGFVYFGRLDAHAGPVDLAARVIDARTGEIIGRALIPIARP